MLYVFFEDIGINKEVVDVSDAEDVKEVTDAVVNVGLEGVRSIGKAKWHDEVFE